jgi:hypothetical protein
VDAGEYRAPVDHAGEEENAERYRLRVGECQLTARLLSQRPDCYQLAQGAAVCVGLASRSLSGLSGQAGS